MHNIINSEFVYYRHVLKSWKHPSLTTSYIYQLMSPHSQSQAQSWIYSKWSNVISNEICMLLQPLKPTKSYQTPGQLIVTQASEEKVWKREMVRKIASQTGWWREHGPLLSQKWSHLSFGPGKHNHLSFGWHTHITPLASPQPSCPKNVPKKPKNVPRRLHKSF